MKVLGKIIWLLAAFLLLPDSLSGGITLLPQVLMEAVDATANPLREESAGEETKGQEEMEVKESEEETKEETLSPATLSSGEGIAAMAGQLAAYKFEHEKSAADTMSPAEAAYARFTKNELADTAFLLEQIFCVDATTTSKGIDWDANTFLARDFSLAREDTPQILIFHTHSQETFADSAAGDSSMTVQGIGEILAGHLRSLGYQVIHNTSTFDIEGGELDRSKAYTYAQNWLDSFLAEHPAIQVIIDLHRDSVDEKTHLVTEVNGKKTAQVMLFNGLCRTSRGEIGLKNSYLMDNLAFSFQIKMEGENRYPGFLRKIYLKGYRYNLHYRPRSLLLEVGAQNNTFEEAANAMEPFAGLLDQVLSGGA